MSAEPYFPFPLTTDAAALGLRTRRVPTRFGDVVLRRRGRGRDAIVLLHGAAGAWTTWTPLLTAIDAPDVVLLDLPGWGDSPLPSPPTVEALSAAVAEALEASGVRTWRVVGHSLGGFVALHLAATRPDAVRSAALVSATTLSVLDGIERPLRRFGTSGAFTALLQVMRVGALLGAAAHPIARGLARLGVLKVLMRPLFAHGGRIDRSAVDALARDIRPRSFALAAAAVRRYPARTLWRGIRCPVVAVSGERDLFVLEEDRRELGGIVPGSVHLTLPGAGHFAHVEQPATTARLLGLGG
ncbi:alpha/beta fold hydrolase [Desertivibrio insolitus]|uniref:alpha/beta fold hydrolase n=1 Tax=Herbiconiux sp. SYSU D00978 TaxID=2812562 RepID=UPI001A967BD4|nr:alpha/beta hydrolase [Herbiconiux sp. SYSU D00978]